uniref:(California timema) hypothetical protein n=1 Tax=Timema californicum TaxID=61474 RepID=A0A7R9JJE5_TIMCA|nr:unnamed protein product [Timema californicum]
MCGAVSLSLADTYCLQILWALHQSGMVDIFLYISSMENEHQYYMHILEIVSLMLREQSPVELASAALQRSSLEKQRDESELLAIRLEETQERFTKVRKYAGARHSRFGGTFVLKAVKSISDQDLIYHKPLNNIEDLNFDVDKVSVYIVKHTDFFIYFETTRLGGWMV